MVIEGVETKIIIPNYNGNGKSLFNLCHKIDKFKQRPLKDILLGKYSHGSRGADHFHKGLDLSKDPEDFLVLSGALELIAVNWLGQEMSEVIVAKENEIPLVSITRDVYHLTIPRQSGLVIAELRVTEYDTNNSDTYHGKKTFYEYTSEKYGNGIHVGI
ncbi:hypothetical protein HYX15_04135 [Candidatus Woesearchaeota archaeon]|nr:hypothetical protein [Candidatus Woesearchaeota archaeon]